MSDPGQSRIYIQHSKRLNQVSFTQRETCAEWGQQASFGTIKVIRFNQGLLLWRSIGHGHDHANRPGAQRGGITAL